MRGPYLGWVGVLLSAAEAAASWFVYLTWFRRRWVVEALPIASDKQLRHLANDSARRHGTRIAVVRASEVAAAIDAAIAAIAGGGGAALRKG